MKKLWKNKPILIAIIAIIGFTVLCAFTLGQRSTTAAENLFGGALIPIAQWTNGITTDVTDFFERVFYPSKIQQENDRLRAELESYKLKDTAYEQTSKENARLASLLSYAQQNPNMSFVTAKVIATGFNEYVDTLTLNVGTRHGVRLKQPVVTGGGIVGRVSEVGASWCKVKTMLNDDMRISAMVSRTRDEGMFGGVISYEGSSALLQLYYLPANSVVEVGDVILTSGLGGEFPKGMLVGEVIALPTARDGFDAAVLVDIDFEHLEEVMVVLNMDEQVTG